MRLASPGILYLLFWSFLYVAVSVLAVGARQQLSRPFADITFALAAVALLWCLIRGPRRSLAIAASTLIVAAVVTISGGLAASLTVVALLLGSMALGSAVLRALRLSTELDPTQRTLFAIPIGFGVLSYGVLALGLTGQLRPLPMLGLLALIGLAFGRRLIADALDVARAQRAVPDKRIGPAGALIAVFGLVALVHTVAPEIQYDALSYHLGLPRTYVDAGAIVPVPEQYQSYFYLGTEMNFTLAFGLGGQVAAKVLSLVLLGVTALAIRVFGAVIATSRAAVWGALLYLSTPAVFWGATTTYVDVVLSSYVFVAVIAAYRAIDRRDVRFAALAGLLAGLALSTKLTAVIAVIPLGIVLAVALFRVARDRAVISVFAFAAAFAVAGLPWPVLRYVQTGNPVFPLLNNFFRSALWPPVNETFNFGTFGIGTDPLALVSLPISVTFDAVRFVEAMSGSAIGLTILLFPIALVFTRGVGLRFVAAVSALVFVVWALSSQYLRYLLPALAPLALLIAASIDVLAVRAVGLARVVTSLPLVIGVAGLPLVLATYWNVPELVPYPVALGLEDRSAYLQRILPTYAAFRAVSEQGSDTYVVLVSKDAGFGDDENRLYAPGRVETNTSRPAAVLFSTQDAETASAWLRDHAVTHILVDRRGLHGPLASAVIGNVDFLNRVGELVYSAGFVEIYRLRR